MKYAYRALVEWYLQGKPKFSENYSIAISFITYPTWTGLGSNLGLCSEQLVTSSAIACCHV